MYKNIHHIALAQGWISAGSGLGGGDTVARMVRKQLYLDEAIDRRLAQRAELLGVSQAQLVRVAVDRYLDGGQDQTRTEAWVRLRAAIEKIQSLGPVPGGGQGRSWKREDLYDRT